MNSPAAAYVRRARPRVPTSGWQNVAGGTEPAWAAAPRNSVLHGRLSPPRRESERPHLAVHGRAADAERVRRCRDIPLHLHQEPLPARSADGGMTTGALVVHVVGSKFCDSLPVYRQAQMFTRQGIAVHRSTLSAWVGGTCWWREQGMPLLWWRAAQVAAEPLTVPPA